LDRAKPSYLGGMLEQANARLYAPWARLTQALRTGEAQVEGRRTDDEMFQTLYADPVRLAEFLEKMNSWSLPSANAVAAAFPFERYAVYADIGCAIGGLVTEVLSSHPHLTGVGFDLTPVEPHFRSYAEQRGVGDRVDFI